MPITSFLFGNRPQAIIGCDESKNGGLVVDASLNEEHEANAELTANEIEDGSQVNDNVRLMPLRLTIEAVVSKYPLKFWGSAFTTAAAAAGAQASRKLGPVAGGVATAAGAALGGLLLGSRDPQDTYKFLVQLRDARKPFTVVTGLKVYDSMIIVGLKATRNAKVGQSLRFTATVQQAKIVGSSWIKVPEFLVKDGQSAASGSTKQDLGTQSAGEASDATASNGSTLFNLFH